jgi:site-specific recombinase XerD
MQIALHEKNGVLYRRTRELLEELSQRPVHLSNKRREGIINQLRSFARELEKPMDKVSKEDILKALGVLGRVKKNSFRAYMTLIKQYHKFIGREDIVETIKLLKS